MFNLKRKAEASPARLAYDAALAELAPILATWRQLQARRSELGALTPQHAQREAQARKGEAEAVAAVALGNADAAVIAKARAELAAAALDAETHGRMVGTVAAEIERRAGDLAAAELATVTAHADHVREIVEGLAAEWQQVCATWAPKLAAMRAYGTAATDPERAVEAAIRSAIHDRDAVCESIGAGRPPETVTPADLIARARALGGAEWLRAWVTNDAQHEPVEVEA